MKNKGRFQKGKVTNTFGQMKKHVSQMNQKEVKAIRNHISTMVKDNPYQFKPDEHLIIQIKKGKVVFEATAVVEILKGHYNLIEYNYKPHTGERRCLLRGTKSKVIEENGRKVPSNLCLVVDVDSGKLVTAWWNAVNDNHRNVNMNRYDETLEVKLG